LARLGEARRVMATPGTARHGTEQNTKGKRNASTI
jgi:hypothetical protein